MRGTVESFDEEVGLGTVRSRQGALFPFHSTQIEDGTRRIAVGTAVTFDVVAGHRGQWEAAALGRC